MKKIVLLGNNKPHMTSQLRKAIMKRSRLKNKANKSNKPADKTAYKTQRNLVVKLNKEAKNFFLKNHVTAKMQQTKQKKIGNYANLFSETTYIINNCFVSITKSLNICLWNPEKFSK